MAAEEKPDPLDDVDASSSATRASTDGAQRVDRAWRVGHSVLADGVQDVPLPLTLGRNHEVASALGTQPSSIPGAPIPARMPRPIWLNHAGRACRECPEMCTPWLYRWHYRFRLYLWVAFPVR